MWILRRGQIAGRGAIDAAAVVATTTWNPASHQASIALSNGNLTATSGASGSFFWFRAIASHSSGQYYYEVHPDTATTPALCMAGVGNATGTSFVGQDLNSIGWASDGTVYLNNAAFSTIQTWAVGNTLCVAFDIGAQRVWFRTNGGNWNNSGAADPATGVGGLSTATLNAGPYFPMGSVRTSGDAFTANFGGSAYAQAAPSGYGNW